MYQCNVRSMSPNECEMWKINTKFETQRFSDAEVLMEDARQSIWFLYEMELCTNLRTLKMDVDGDHFVSFLTILAVPDAVR